MNKDKMTLKEMLKRKDFILSTNIERSLYDLLIKSGLNKEDVLAKEMFDKQVGETKERIYKEFSKALNFKYHWSGYYILDNYIK